MQPTPEQTAEKEKESDAAAADLVKEEEEEEEEQPRNRARLTRQSPPTHIEPHAHSDITSPPLHAHAGVS